MAGLSGSGVIMRSHMERQKMERPDIIMEGIMEKPFMMEISVWMGWFIRIVHRIQDCWSIKMSIVRLGLCPMIRKMDR